MEKKVFGIDLGTTYSCIAYIDEHEKPVVLNNAEGESTTPSVVWFENANTASVGNYAKEAAMMHPKEVVSLIKRSMGEVGFRRNIHGIDMSPEEISSKILRKLIQDAEKRLRELNKLGEEEKVQDVVITCPAYFGVDEREATKKAGEIAGLNVLGIINEPTAAAISYGVIDDGQNKNVLVYDLGGGTFDVTLVNIKPGEIRVVCTGGDKTLGGSDWDKQVLIYIAGQFQDKTGVSAEELLDDSEIHAELLLGVERAKKDLTTRERAKVTVRYKEDRADIELTREKFDELTEDLLTRTISLTRDMLVEAEKKGFPQSDINEILLVGGSTYMPQVMNRVRSEFGIETRRYDPNEAVAKGAAIFAKKQQDYNVIIEAIADETGQDIEVVKDEVNSGKVDISKEVGKLGLPPMHGGINNIKIINVCSRSFGTTAYSDYKARIIKLFNIILRNTEVPATGEDTFYPVEDNQSSLLFKVMESLTSEKVVDPELGKELGTVNLALPAGTTTRTEIRVTYSLDENGLLHFYAKEMQSGRDVKADFQTVGALSQEEFDEAIERNQNSKVE